MIHCKAVNQVINRTHLCALHVVHMKDATFENLLSDSNTIHVQNLHHLMAEVYKCIYKLNPAFMWEIFKINTTPYDLRIGKLTELPKTKTKCYGINDFIEVAFYGTPFQMKLREKKLHNTFKRSIKNVERKIRI